MEDPTKYKQELNKMKEYKDEIKYVLLFIISQNASLLSFFHIYK